jgi:hypothetical protein
MFSKTTFALAFVLATASGDSPPRSSRASRPSRRIRRARHIRRLRPRRQRALRAAAGLGSRLLIREGKAASPEAGRFLDPRRLRRYRPPTARIELIRIPGDPHEKALG